MRHIVLIAVEAPDAELAASRASELIDDYPVESDCHTIVETIPAAGDKEIHPDVMARIEEANMRKDARIAEGLRAFAPLVGDAQKVVTSLKPDPDTIDDRRAAWTEALETGGLSLSIHRNGHSGQRGLMLYEMQKTLKMMGDDFHHNVGFYDGKELTTSLEWFMERIAENPTEQWVVVINMHS